MNQHRMRRLGSLLVGACLGVLIFVGLRWGAPVKALPVAFETVARIGRQEPGWVVVTTPREWEQLWSELRNRADERPPEVNFDEALVIGVFSGERPTGGYRIEIVQLTQVDDTYRVVVRERQPDPDALVTMALTYPGHIVQVPRAATGGPRAVRFVSDEGRELGRFPAAHHQRGT